MELGQRILAAVEEAASPWAISASYWKALLRKHVSQDLLRAADLLPNAKEKASSLEEINARFLKILGSKELPQEFRNEAAEVLFAISLYNKSGMVSAGPIPVGEIGRVCRWCWRTEQWKSGHKLFGLCNVHDPRMTEAERQARSQKGWTREHEARLEARIKQARRDVDRSRRLVEAAPANAFHVTGYDMVSGRSSAVLFPRYVKRGIEPPDLAVTVWEDFVVKEFALTAEYLSLLKQLAENSENQAAKIVASGSLANPVGTLIALEARELTPAESVLTNDPWNWLPTLYRSEAWLNLIQCSRLQ
jgi:hypothetical protein